MREFGALEQRGLLGIGGLEKRLALGYGSQAVRFSSPPLLLRNLHGFLLGFSEVRTHRRRSLKR